MARDRNLIQRIVLSLLAVTAAILHMLAPKFIPDAITAGLIVLAFVPWLSSIVKSIEVPGVGKLELKVEEMREKQAVLQEEVDGLRFLVTGFVTEWEYVHLNKLAREEAFDYVRGADKDDRFVNELIRLRDYGLIKKRIEYSMHDIPVKGDLRNYVEITDRGRTYLRLREQLESRSRS